jgi:hypothetical protein
MVKSARVKGVHGSEGNVFSVAKKSIRRKIKD